MSKIKGHKNLKGVPELWDELKRGTKFTITPTALSGLEEIARSLGISRSELVERIGRGAIEIKVKEDDADVNSSESSPEEAA